MSFIPPHLQLLFKPLLAPMIKLPINPEKLENYKPTELFSDFKKAWDALNEPVLLSFIQQQVNIISRTKNVSTRFLLQENARDLFQQTICIFANKFKRGGFVFDDFDSASETSVRSWFKTVSRNAANDALKLKQPKQTKIRIDKGFDQDDQLPFILKTTTLDPLRSVERKEALRLKNWLKSLPLLIANAKENRISPTKIIIWKLYEYPEQVTLEELETMNSRNLRKPLEIFQLLRFHMKDYLDIKNSDDAKGTHRKNFLVWLLFGASYSSYQEMIFNCDQQWLAKVRDNQIRKAYGRAVSDIWTLILFRLLNSTITEGYETWFHKTIQYAFIQSANNLHTSRKGMFLSHTSQELQRWCAGNLSPSKTPRFSKLQDLFAILYSESNNRLDWITAQSPYKIDKITLQFKIAKKIIPPHPFHSRYALVSL